MKDKREEIQFEFAQELKDFLVIYDYEEFVVCSKIQYESYVRRALGHGATPAVKVVTHFNKEDSLFQPKREEPIEDKALDKRWVSTEAFVAACKAVDAISSTTGKNGLQTIDEINTFQELLIQQGFSILPAGQNKLV